MERWPAPIPSGYHSIVSFITARTLFVVSGLIITIVACGDEDATGGGSGPSRDLGVAKQDGVATFYDADGSGNCSFDKSSDLDVAAMAKPEYNASASCGACLRVTGPKGDVLVRVVDSCPGCADGNVNLDLSAQAFAKIANPKDGRVPITYQLVSCQVTGNLAFHFKDGSSKYWTAIQVRNHRVPVKKLEYEKKGVYVTMERADYNYFIASDGVGDQPNGLKLRVTASDGQVIEDTLALSGGIQADSTVTGSKQFQ